MRLESLRRIIGSRSAVRHCHECDTPTRSAGEKSQARDAEPAFTDARSNGTPESFVELLRLKHGSDHNEHASENDESHK